MAAVRFEMAKGPDELMTSKPRKTTKVSRGNGLVIGALNVGKSTLIGEIFKVVVGSSSPAAGHGTVQTLQVRKYENDALPFALYDCPGIEGDVDEDGKNQRTIQGLTEFVKQENTLADDSQHLNFAWYCIHSLTTRFQDCEREFLKFLAGQCPVVVVLESLALQEKTNLCLAFSPRCLMCELSLPQAGKVYEFDVWDVVGESVSVPYAECETFKLISKAISQHTSLRELTLQDHCGKLASAIAQH